MRTDLGRHLARQHGNRVALVNGLGGERLTFRQLDADAEAWAHRLHEFGVASGDRVSVLSDNDVRAVALWFGCLKTGAALVPHNLRLSPPEVDAQIRRVLPKLLVLGPGAPRLGDETLARSIPTLPLAGDGGTRGRLSAASPREWESPALVLFTGGSTGTPKGAVLSLRAVISNAANTALSWGLRSDDATLLVYPLFHTGGWNVLTLPLLLVGGRTVMIAKFDTAAVLRLLETEGVTLFSGVPSMFVDLVAHPSFPKARFPALRWVKSGGGTSPAYVVQAFRDRGIPFYQGYGLTEAGPNLFFSGPEDLDRPFTVGRPSLLADMRLADPDGRDANPGELLVGGPVVFSGYLMAPEAETETMKGGYLWTGDILRRDGDGFYYFVGRRKLMFKSGGENVYPTEVEQVLESHPAVVESAVVGVPDARWGEVGRAFVACRSPVKQDELRAFLRDRVAHYKVPKTFVFLPQIPRTSSGKKDYPGLQRGDFG